MRKSGLTSATLQELRRKAQETAGIEVEVEMEMSGEPIDLGEESPEADGASNEDIAPDLPGEPWDENWEVTDPIVDEPEDNTSRNRGEGEQDAKMVRKVIDES